MIVVYNRDTRDTGGDTGPVVVAIIRSSAMSSARRMQGVTSSKQHPAVLVMLCGWSGSRWVLHKHPISHSVTLGLMSTCTVLNYGHYIIVRFDDGEQVGN